MKDDNRFIKHIYTRFLIGSVFALLASVVGQIVNNIIIGNKLGVEALSITGLVVPIYYLFATVGNLLGIGGAAVCSKLTGSGEHQKSRQAFTVTYLLSVVSALLLTAITLPLLPWLIRLLGTPEALWQDVYRYSVVMIVGGVFTIGVYLAFNFLRLDGRTGASMFVFVVMALVNIALDFLFLYGLDMGIVGVSIATSAGAAAASIMGAVILFTRGKSLRLTKFTLREGAELSVQVLTTGSPGATENVAILLRSLVLNRLILTSFGTVAMSAFSVIGSVNSFAISIIAGVSGTLVPFVGVFSAERDTRSMRQLLWLSLRQGTVLTCLFAVVCMVFRSQIGAMFGMSGPVEGELVSVAILLFGVSLLPSLVNNILICLHLSNGHTAIANVLTLSRNFVGIVLPALLLSKLIGVNGVWHSFWVCEVLTLLLALVLQWIAARKSPYVSTWTLINSEAEKNGHYISFSVEDNLESITGCVDSISEFCEENELSPKRAMMISLSLEEMLNSILTHSLSSHQGLTMNVRILLFDGGVILRIRNAGEQFNPLRYYEEKKENLEGDGLDAMLELEDSLGIKMIVDTAEAIDYRRTFGVNNLTVILS